jgi:hypothetical protein
MKIYLHVTSTHQPFDTVWTGYIVENGLAYPLAGFDNLSRAHDWALREGFAGYLIGAPSVPWVAVCNGCRMYPSCNGCNRQVVFT